MPILALALVGLALAGALLALAAQRGERQGGKLAASVTWVWSGQTSGKQGDLEFTDQVTVTYVATLSTSIPAGDRVWDANTMTEDWNISAAGGGQARASKHSSAWTYEVKMKKPKAPMKLLNFFLDNVEANEGRFKIVRPLDIINDYAGVVPVFASKPKSKDLGEAIEQQLYATGIALFAGSAYRALRLAEGGLDFPEFNARARSFDEQLEGKVDAKSGSFARSGKASSSVSDQKPDFRSSASVQVSYTMSFNLGEKDLEAVMWVESSGSGEKYDTWVPLGGPDETQRGDLLTVRVKLQAKDKPSAEVHEKATFRFELEEVSTEPGVAMNWPKQGTEGVKGTPDLGIEDQYNPMLEVATTWETTGGKAGPRGKTKTKDTKAEVVISSFDYGAWGTLKVYADLESGETLVVRLKDKPGVKELKLPKDENGNHIADAWERQMGLEEAKPEADDDDIPKADGTKGDGLSVYEEYRGFMVLPESGPGLDRHVRTNPKKKTLFINYRDVPDATPGVELFKSMSGLEVYSISEEQYGDNAFRVINVNQKTNSARVDQHGLRLTIVELDEGTAGQSPFGPPRYVDKVEFNPRYVRPGRDLDLTVAHELGHAVGMPHHGRGDYLCKKSAECRRKLGARAAGLKVAVQHGEHSGGQPCIMRYQDADLIERIDRGEKWFPAYCSYGEGDCSEKEEQGARFCRSDRATGVNAPEHKPWPKAGEATRGCGNSMGRIRISDRYDSVLGQIAHCLGRR